MNSEINGLILYFGLEDWWLNELTKPERDRLIETYGKQLTEGKIHSTSRTKLSMLCNLSSFWKPDADDLLLAKKIKAKAKTIKTTQKEDEFWLDWLTETES